MIEHPTILLVEDDVLLRQLQMRLLRFVMPSARVIDAGSVAGALEIFEREAVALLVIDHNLPDGSGVDIIRAVRQQNAAVPIVLTSAYYGNGFGARAAGATKFLPKPLEIDHLVKEVLPLLTPVTQTIYR